jgi:hypothetical protein
MVAATGSSATARELKVETGAKEIAIKRADDVATVRDFFFTLS